MDKYNIHNMLEDVSQNASTMLSSGKSSMKEMGEMADMIKDLSEAEKNKWESCYYKSIVEAMEESEYGEDYDYRGRMGYQGNRGGRMMGSRMGYNDMMYPEYMNNDYERMGYSNGAYRGSQRGMSNGYSQGNGGRGQSQSQGRSNSRYGYSHDEYMSEKAMYSPNDAEGKKKRAEMIEDRMDDLYDMFKDEVKDMTPEEKQMWKTKLNKVINL